MRDQATSGPKRGLGTLLLLPLLLLALATG
jgi:hypothetical protein